jgi:hypothetical protein
MLFWADLVTGWDAVTHTMWTKTWQQQSTRDKILTPFTVKPPATVIDLGAASGTGNGAVSRAAQRVLDAAPTAADDAPLDAPLDGPSDEDVALAEIAGATDDDALKAIYAKHRALWTSPDAVVPTAWREKRVELTV